MEKDPEVIARLAAQRDAENWRFFTYLKARRIPAGKLDAMAERFARQAEAAMDCTRCGACCRENCITVNEEEIQRLIRRTDLDWADFVDRYLTVDDDGQPALDASPCPFLDSRRCSVYEDRPDACRGYPYIGGPVLAGQVGILERAGTCPIVFEMLEQLKQATGFDRLG